MMDAVLIFHMGREIVPPQVQLTGVSGTVFADIFMAAVVAQP
jgi:hypothetical protein